MAVKATINGAPVVNVSPDLEVETTEEEDIQEHTGGFTVVQASKEHKTPDFPAIKIEAHKAQLYFDWVEKLGQEDMNHLQFYLYRHYPVIDRQKVNPKAGINIDKFATKADCTLEALTKKHGSGLYKILINDINKTQHRGKGGTIGTVMISITDAFHPPILRLDELVMDHPNNRTYIDSLVAEGKITAEGIPMVQMQGNSENAALVGLVSRLLEKLTSQPTQVPSSTADVSKMFLDANSAVVGMLKEQAKSDGPGTLMTMLAALKEMIPTPQDNSGMMAMFMKMQVDAQARESAANERMFTLLTKPQEDNETKLLERIALYKELFGGGNGETHTPKRGTAEVVIDALQPVVLRVFDVIANVMTMQNYKAGMAKQVQQPAALAGPVETPPAGGDNVVQMPSQQVSENEQLLTQYGGLIINAIKRGVPGSAFAQSVEDMIDPLLYKRFKMAGAASLLEGMKSVPVFWNALISSGASEPIVSEWIDDFIRYGSEEEEGEDTKV